MGQCFAGDGGGGSTRESAAGVRPIVGERGLPGVVARRHAERGGQAGHGRWSGGRDGSDGRGEIHHGVAAIKVLVARRHRILRLWPAYLAVFVKLMITWV